MTLKRFLIPLFLLFVLFAIPTPTRAQVKSFYWERVDVDIHLQDNGDLRVTEEQTLVFSGGTFTFGYRTIPHGISGGNDGIEDISVREGAIQYEPSYDSDYTFIVDRSGSEVKVNWYFPATQGRHTYTFEYTVKSAVRVGTGEADAGDQIFWMAIPDDHPARIENSRVTIHLPEGIRPQVYTGTNDPLVEAYIDGRPSRDVAIQVSDDGRRITYNLNRSLNTGQALEVRVQFPSGALAIGTPDWQRQEQLADVWKLILIIVGGLILVAGPLAVFLLWYLRGRDPDVGLVPDYLSEPPDELPPAVAGTLIDEQADMQDVVSTLLSLAQNGYLTMEETKNDHIFTLTGKDRHGLRPYEKQFIKAFFKNKQSRSLTSLRYKFAQSLGPIQNALYDEMVREKLFNHSPESVRMIYRVLAIGSTAVVGGLTLVLAPVIVGETAAGFAMCPAIAIGISGVALLFAAGHMPAKTVQGAQAAARWGAFKTYLKEIEKYTNLQEAGDIFEKYLPYAVAFGLERSWIRKFAAVPTTPVPTWYAPYPRYDNGRVRGGRGKPAPTGSSGRSSTPSLEGMSGGLTGGLAGMSGSLTQMLNSTSSILRSTPPSSSSGGSSGGFSGGGSSGGGSMGFG